MDVDITNVKKLKLETRGSGARWLFGSAAWGDAQAMKAFKPRPKPKAEPYEYQDDYYDGPWQEGRGGDEMQDWHRPGLDWREGSHEPIPGRER